jgi:thiamine kinase-like enzyme
MIDERVKEPLARVGMDERFSSSARNSARLGLERLERDEWKPKQGMVHYDVWKGNILLHRANAMQRKPSCGFYLIDWGAADAESFFFWDLAKFADSFNLPVAWLRHTLGRQCSLLGWNACDAVPSLLLAAERLGGHLGYYPAESYVNAVERYHALLSRALA